jgi:hypothetical protein
VTGDAWSARFDSALRVNVHFHVVWADGAFTRAIGAPAARFWEAAGVTDADVRKLVGAIRGRVLRKLQRMGKWPAEDGGGEEANGDVMQELGSAAVQGRAALGERAGARDEREARGTRNEPFVKGPLCAEVDGFSLHAGVRVEAGDRRRLEHLCRYVCRPAIAESRLTLLPDGRDRNRCARRMGVAVGQALSSSGG